ncbi:hypothetical protein [Methylobacter marinus]|uniref:hypothetical protein n=1 Tax=Methylobacter marinus TaxID=34058 RepID=UPI0012EBD2AF|nr:hypothetical protein [Methylobacter marinus]
MRFNILSLLLLLSSLESCAWNNAHTTSQEQNASIMPNRNRTVSFFSRIHRGTRDTERAICGFLYGVRDGVDRFIYDVEKDYYDDYQK